MALKTHVGVGKEGEREEETERHIERGLQPVINVTWFLCHHFKLRIV